jgi:hypothetical protein
MHSTEPTQLEKSIWIESIPNTANNRDLRQFESTHFRITNYTTIYATTHDERNNTCRYQHIMHNTSHKNWGKW